MAFVKMGGSKSTSWDGYIQSTEKGTSYYNSITGGWFGTGFQYDYGELKTIHANLNYNTGTRNYLPIVIGNKNSMQYEFETAGNPYYGVTIYDHTGENVLASASGQGGTQLRVLDITNPDPKGIIIDFSFASAYSGAYWSVDIKNVRFF